MKYFRVSDGFESLEISKLMLGSIYFGLTIPDREFFSMIDAFLDRGGSMIDTARCYANWVEGGDGSSERAIGRYLKASGKRNHILIGTKGGNTKKGENPYRANLSQEGLTRELNESLSFLGVDYVDLYWLHRDDPRLPVEEIVERVNGFIKEGKVQMVGVSNWREERLLAANEYAASKGLRPFVMNQVQFSLARTTAERCGDHTIICMDEDREKWYNDHGISIAAFTAQAQGFFTKVMEKGVDSLKEDTRNKFYYGENIEKIAKVKRIMEETGYSATQVALGYLTHHPVQTSAILGSRNMEQLLDSLTGAEVELTQDQFTYLAK